MLIQTKKKIHNNYIKIVTEIFLDAEFPKGMKSFSDVSIDDEADAFKVIRIELDKIGYDRDVDKLFKKVRTYISKGLGNLYWDYFNTDYVKNFLFESLIKSRSANGIDNTSVDSVQKLEIVRGFYEFFMASSKDKFAISSGTLAAYVNSCFQFYLKGGVKAHPELKSVFGTQINYDGEILDLAQQLHIEEKVEDDSEFDFKTDVKKIYEASNVLFKNKGDSSASLYSDIFSCYVKWSSKSDDKMLAEMLGLTFCPDNVNYEKSKFLVNPVYFIPIIDSRNSSCTEYQAKTLEAREEVLYEWFKRYSDSISVESVFEFLDYLFKKECSIRGNKNVSNIFSSIGDGNGTVGANGVEVNLDLAIKINQEGVINILDGMFSLYRLIGYCSSRGINLSSIPYEIFRKVKYANRFDNLEDCSYCFPKTKALIDNEKYRSAERINSLYDNDSTYQQVIVSPKFAGCNFLSAVPEITRQEEQQKRLKELQMTYAKLADQCRKSVLSFKKLEKIIIGASQQKPINECFEIFNDSILKGNQNVINTIKEIIIDCVSNDYLEDVDEIIFTVFDEGYPYHDFFERAIWYLYMRLNLLGNLKSKIELMLNDNLVNVLNAAKTGVLKNIKDNVSNVNDLESYLSSSYLTINPDITDTKLEYAIGICGVFYSSLVNEFEDLVDSANSFVNEKKKYLKSLHVDYDYGVYINEELQQISLTLWQRGEKHSSDTLNNLLIGANVEGGYLYKYGKPILLDGGYVHEFGFRVCKNDRGKYVPLAITN